MAKNIKSKFEHVLNKTDNKIKWNKNFGPKPVIVCWEKGVSKFSHINLKKQDEVLLSTKNNLFWDIL